jgi:hypothetical protein
MRVNLANGRISCHSDINGDFGVTLMLTWMRRVVACSAILVVASCGGSSDSTGLPGPPANGEEFFATLNDFRVTLRATASLSETGAVTILALPAQTNDAWFSLAMENIAGAGTYPVGYLGRAAHMSAAIFFGLAGGGSAYADSGSVTVTTFTESRVAGSFKFFAQGSGSSAPNVVRDGRFDLRVLGPLTTLRPNSTAMIYGGLSNLVRLTATEMQITSPPASGTLAFRMRDRAAEAVVSIPSYAGPATYPCTTGMAAITLTAGERRLTNSLRPFACSVTISFADARTVRGVMSASMTDGSASTDDFPRLSGSFYLATP